MKTALICGITGQDGAYLAHNLLTHGYSVIGTSRNPYTANCLGLRRLSIESDIELIALDPCDFENVTGVVARYMPDEIYNLSGQSSVGKSFLLPVETYHSIAISTLNFLEAIRSLACDIRFFNAGSTECFGNTREPAIEATSFHPRSPYAAAKSAAFWLVATYREAYKIFCCTGILSNHESSLRSTRFVTQKIVSGVKDIKERRMDVLELGNLDIRRDWGWAPDYVEAMRLIVSNSRPKDYIVATGTTSSLWDFVHSVFSAAGVDPVGKIKVSPQVLRPLDVKCSLLSPSLIENDLGWKSSAALDLIAEKMYNSCLF